MLPEKISYVGFIGGSGLYELSQLTDVEQISVETPFGSPSDLITTGKIEGKNIAFLPRHGRGHKTLPTEVNYRANIYAMKKIGATHLIGISAVGSLNKDLSPGTLVIPDQVIDETKGVRKSSFFGDGIVGHVSFADPFCLQTRMIMKKSVERLNVKKKFNGTYVCIEGPRFSSKAESLKHRKNGADIIGMTLMPEAILAREAELPYATVCLVTDYDCLFDEVVNVELVMKTLRENSDNAKNLVNEIMKEFPNKSSNEIFCSAKNSIMTKRDLIPQDTIQRLNLLYEKYFN